ncbi:site-2 protease family protein [Lederbergia wuyishanensis]|uniref:Stage IV sporulation protein FB n=1 Tax=Lederbergia wuyishanensis TaxID=1347903 RepID=A0ABU0D1T9_9BACI|nr:site-2 protease family protein [Lederbergia wuyishanensis]MCJ8006976.1 site-2 protease family protein [Lederbergia wuyishanensis]MDQ0342360.1 stage IV sporulation protein FB [Lederbergia wuyishanensis]
MNKYGVLLKKIQIHPLFWGVAGIAIITGYFWQLLFLFMIVFIHEIGHAAAAAHFGWKIKRIVILPFGGLCEVDEHGNREINEDLIVIVAGPLQHLIIAAIIPMLVMFSFLSADVAKQLSLYNFMILMFNLIPVWPLDGGKLIQLFLSTRHPYIKACRISLVSSFAVLIALHTVLLLFYPLNINIWLILLYLDLTLWSDWKQQRYVFMRFLLERHYGKTINFSQLQPIDARGEEYLHEVLERFKRGCKHLIYVEGKNSSQGKLDENEILHAYFTEKRVSAQLKDLVYDD